MNLARLSCPKSKGTLFTMLKTEPEQGHKTLKSRAGKKQNQKCLNCSWDNFKMILLAKYLWFISCF